MSESTSEAAEVAKAAAERSEGAEKPAEASESFDAAGASEPAEESGGPFSGRTAWARRMETPLRTFLRTETGSASVLAAATVAALVWANISVSSYDRFWATELSFLVGSSGVVIDLREFVNSGLMALFFLVVGLEARREFDMGELRVRSRVALPFLAGLGGMVVPISIYLVFNAGRPSEHGWGMAMSTDTAFALGALALVGRRLPDRVRTYLLTFSVVDDLAGIAVIAIAYSGRIDVIPLLFGIGFFAVVLIIRARGVQYGPAYLLIGIAAWVAFLKSGVDPIVVGLVMGLLTYAYSATRASLEQASEAFRLFREQPTAELAATAQGVVRTAISPNDRLSQIFHPWTSYVIVPLFALANAGIVLNGGFLARAYTSPVTLGILVGYLVGKPLGTAGCAWLVTKLSHGRLRPPVGWGAVAGAGAVAGIGFTVSLLIASLALQGTELAEAKLGILSAALAASGLTWVIFRLVNRLPTRTRLRALLGTAEAITDLVVPVDPERDHIRGPAGSPGHRGRVRGLRVPLLRPGRAGRAGAAAGVRRRPVRVAAPAADRRPPGRAAGGRGRRGSRAAGQVLGDARPAPGPPGRAATARPDRVRGLARPRHRPVRRRPAQARGRRARERGRGFRRPVQCVGDADVLRQRQAALRRL